VTPLAVSTGDPGGIGPEVSVRAALAQTDDAVLLFGDAERLLARLQALGGAERCAPSADGTFAAGQIGLVDVGRCDDEALRHEPTRKGGRAQLAALQAAMNAVQDGRARALVTAPMSKTAVTAAGRDFVGHTEYLASEAGLDEDAVTMMFLGPRLNVALVTTHLALCEVPSAVTPARVSRAIVHLGEALLRLAPPDASPRLVVAGLNPHAGEGGLFGTEEATVIAPVIRELLSEAPFSDERVRLRGPEPTETVFRQAAAGEIDGVVAMAHDHATIASKILDWGTAVNVTWGLPYVRTSVDHGVAYEAARAGTADDSGMRAALAMAARLAPQ
jgi:4-hydroxythreonine-4-phosphate dehydrogenase